MQIIHVDRDYNKPLKTQLKKLKAIYPDMEYLYCHSFQIHFLAATEEGKEEKK